MVALVALLMSSCAAGPAPKSRVDQRAPATLSDSGEPIKAPFRYEPMYVRNGCFVESVRVYDDYLSRFANQEDRWVRVLQWRNRISDTELGLGHAVTVFSWKGHLWTFDINHAFTRLAVPNERRADITDVTPEVLARYEKDRPVLPTYRQDGFQKDFRKVPEYLFYHKNPDIREATRVASELGRYRPVRVLEFKYVDRGKTKTGAAAVFVFGNRPCLYMPSKGTQVGRMRVTTIEDLPLLTRLLKGAYASVSDVKWHEGGYWLFPPKS